MPLFLIGMAIGIVVGLLVDHYFLPWLAHQVLRAQIASSRRSPRRRG